MGWARWFILGDLGQQIDINEMRDEVERMRQERITTDWDSNKTKLLAEELLELELRHDLLVRLLISKGVVSAQEYADLIHASRAKPDDGKSVD